MRVTEVIKHVYRVHFDTIEELTHTFIRFEEFYDSPKFHGKLGFTVDEFLAWYIDAAADEAKDYFTYWDAFFVPSHVLRPFYEGAFDPLSEREMLLLDYFRDKEEPYYIIGTYGDSESYLMHETAHALYAHDEGYRKAAQEIIAAMPPIHRRAIKMQLLNLGGYAWHSIESELNSYMLDGMEDLNNLGIDTKSLVETRKKLLALYEKYVELYKV